MINTIKAFQINYIYFKEYNHPTSKICQLKEHLIYFFGKMPAAKNSLVYIEWEVLIRFLNLNWYVANIVI